MLHNDLHILASTMNCTWPAAHTLGQTILYTLPTASQPIMMWWHTRNTITQLDYVETNKLKRLCLQFAWLADTTALLALGGTYLCSWFGFVILRLHSSGNPISWPFQVGLENRVKQYLERTLNNNIYNIIIYTVCALYFVGCGRFWCTWENIYEEVDFSIRVQRSHISM